MAEVSQDVYSIDFDSQNFIAGIEDALNALKKFEGTNDKFADAIQLLSKQVNAVSFTKPITEVNNLKKALEQFSASGNKVNLDQFNKAFDEFSKDAPRIKSFLIDIKKEMSSLDSNSQDFKDLEMFVGQVEMALSDLENQAKETEQQGFVPLRKRLKELKVEMQSLENQGLDNTETFQKMEIEAAKLTDQLGDQSEKIRVLSSDTLAMDATVDTLQNVAAGWQVIEGVMALAGQDNEELQKSMQRLMAVMNIANGLQQINAFLTGQSAGKVVLLNIATKAQAAAQSLVATATGAATAATKAWGTALAATGIGAIVVAVGFLVSALMDYIDTSDEAAAATKNLNDEFERQNLLLELDQSALKRQNDLYIAQLKARGASEKEIQAATISGRQKELQILKEDVVNKSKLVDQTMAAKYTEKGTLQKYQEELLKSEEKYKNFSNSIQIDGYNNQAEALKKRNEAKKKADEDYNKLNDEYLKDLQKHKMDLVKVQESDMPVTESLINARYERELKAEIDANTKKYNTLGIEKVNKLNAIAKQTAQLQAEIEVKGFKEEQANVRAELLKVIQETENGIANEKISLITDENQRVNAAIAQQEKERKQEIAQTLIDTQKDLEQKVKAGLPQVEADKQLAAITELSKKQIELVEQDSYKKRLDNQRAFLDTLLKQAQDYNSLAISEVEKEVSAKVLREAELLASGEISYQQFQDRKLKIEKDGSKALLDTQIANYTDEIKALEDKYRAAEEADKVGIQTQINNLQRLKNEALTAKNTVDKELTGFDGILGKIFGSKDQKDIDVFKQAAQKAINATIDLLRQQAAAEVAAADTAIAAQQKQVDAATKIAEQGNAEYLQQEEEKLKQLQQAREEAAKKQLVIDAALQASQILVGVAGAAAQLAGAGGSPIKVAAGIASLVAALAAGVSLVSSLQSAQPKLYHGTDYVQRGNNPVGRDTIPAMLHEGEAVINSNTNRMYSPTIKAIRRGLIPEGVINKFVKDYTNGVNYDGISKAVEVKVSNERNYEVFGQMSDRLSRLEKVMARTATGIEGLKVNVNMDSDGFAASIQSHLENKNRILNA